MRHRLQVQVTAAALWSTDHMVGFQGLTYCVKDLALVQHLQRTTGTSISQMNMTQTATTLPGNLPQLLLRFWEVVGIVGNESGHASEQDPQLLPLFDVPIRPDLDKQCRGANNDRHSCQSGCGVPISLGVVFLSAWVRGVPREAMQ